jgi:(p)ppGpp synthase/HD superfamily hydrolase
MENNIIEKAVKIAVDAHWEQKDKEDNLPYIIHPIMVAVKLVNYNFSDEIVAAALIHEVLQETKFPEKILRQELGDPVVEIVKTVSHDKTLPWDESKKKYIESVRNGCVGAKAVAVADEIHNLETLLLAYEEHGPVMWRIFSRNKEKKLWFENEMLKMIKETWDHPLIENYEYMVKRFAKLPGYESNVPPVYDMPTSPKINPSQPLKNDIDDRFMEKSKPKLKH